MLLERAFRLLQMHWPKAVERLPGYVVGTLGAFWTIQRVVVLLEGGRMTRSEAAHPLPGMRAGSLRAPAPARTVRGAGPRRSRPGGGIPGGLSHPVSGLDHVLAMVAVGLWGAVLGAPAIWVLPVAFPLVMAVGGLIGLLGVPVPGVEIGIAVSAIVLGVMVLAEVRPAIWVAAAIVAFFAIFHGHAHGRELPAGTSALLYSLGFVVATGLLHVSASCSASRTAGPPAGRQCGRRRRRRAGRPLLPVAGDRVRRAARLAARRAAGLAARPRTRTWSRPASASFYDGLAHVALTPADLLVVVALALLAGQRGTSCRALRAVRAAGGVAGGGAAGAHWGSGGALPLLTTLSFAMVGALVALNATDARRGVAALAVAAGLLHGASMARRWHRPAPSRSPSSAQPPRSSA